MTDLVLRKQEAPADLTESVSWSTVLDTFLDARVDSEHTRRAYRRHIEDFFTAADIATVAEVTGPLLTSYRAALVASELSPNSQKQAIAAVRSFLRWSGMMRAHAFPLELLGETLRTPRASVNKPYSVLTEQEIKEVLASAANMPRDFAILALMVGAGLRVSEVVTLDVADIREDGDGGALLYIRQGKGKKDRTVPVLDDVSQSLRAYLDDAGRTLSSDGALFLTRSRSRHGHRMREGAIRAVVEKYTGRVGIAAKKISPHSLRHTYALRQLKGGASETAISKLLGHASIATTQRYVDHLAVSDLRSDLVPLPTS